MRVIFLLLLLPAFLWGQESIPVIDNLDLGTVPAGTIKKYWLHLADNGLSQPVYVPVIVAKGDMPGPVLGLVAAIHGNELNGIPVIQQIFRELDPGEMQGTVVGVPGLNAVAIPLDQREYMDGIDLNRVFPGSAGGPVSSQYVHRAFDRLIRHFDYQIDMHTASFGRINAFYVRADLSVDTLAQLARLQQPDIILNSKGPSVGQAAAGGRALRSEATAAGIPTITIEYGNPQVYQPELIERGVDGICRTLEYFGIQPFGESAEAEEAPHYCKKSYWVYTDAGGLLEVLPDLNQVVEQGERIAVLRNPFGDVIREYYAPERGVVIGKSTNPVNMNGGRILHLGVLEE